jgi:hypothetical protein
MSDIVKLIEELVEKKTLSLDAVAGVNAVRQRALELEAQITRLETMVESYRKQNEEIRESNLDWAQREEALKARETKMTDLEKQVAVGEARSIAYKDMFDRMFANRIVRESHQTNTWVPEGSGGNQYATQRTNNDNITREEG